MMNRRQMVILPGVALAASQGFAQTPQSAMPSTPGTVSHKKISHYSSLKASYTVPKTEAKQTKYIGFLTTLLSLTVDQQTQAAAIFAAARSSDAELKKNVKSNRQSLRGAVWNSDNEGIGKTSASIGALAAQRHSNGATANAAFFQLLTADQQSKLEQFRS